MRCSPFAVVALVCLGLGQAACVASSGEQAGPGRGKGTATPAVTDREVRALVTGMADDYSAVLAEAMNSILLAEAGDPRGRLLAQGFLRSGAGAAVDIAVGPNPDVALLDLLVLARLQAWTFRTHWAPAIGAVAAGPAERLERASESARRSAARVLTEEQLALVDELTDRWIEENGDRTLVALTRFEEFTDARNLRAESLRRRAAGLLKEVSEATTAVEVAVDLGDRALWYAGRYPTIVGGQAELSAYRLADQPEMRELVETLGAIRSATAALTARLDSLEADLSGQQDELFRRLAAERAAAIEQLDASVRENVAGAVAEAEGAADRVGRETLERFFSGVATERGLLLDDIEARQDELRGLMVELQGTISASGELASELTATIASIDRLASRFERNPDDLGEPLKLTDVRDVAAEFGAAARNATELLEASNTLAESEAWDLRLAALDRATNGAIDRVFWRGVWLVLLLVGGLAVVRLIPVGGGKKALGTGH